MTVYKYRYGGECPKCGQTVKQRLVRHMERCETLPSASEIDDMLQDPCSTIKSIARDIGTRTKWVKSILLSGDNDWTPQSIQEHNYGAREARAQAIRDKHGDSVTRRHITIEGPRCVCGILVEKEQDVCEWCVLESRGIKSYHDMAGGDGGR